jgi:hypothetical protein
VGGIQPNLMAAIDAGSQDGLSCRLKMKKMSRTCRSTSETEWQSNPPVPVSFGSTIFATRKKLANDVSMFLER